MPFIRSIRSDGLRQVSYESSVIAKLTCNWCVSHYVDECIDAITPHYMAVGTELMVFNDPYAKGCASSLVDHKMIGTADVVHTKRQWRNVSHGALHVECLLMHR